MPVRLNDCPVGLFRAASGELCLMTEYATQSANGPVQRDAYIVSSGEYFWGGAKTAEQRGNVLVTPVDVDAALAGAEAAAERKQVQYERSQRYWVDAAQKALAGDTEHLKLRIDMATSGPIEMTETT